ncbi:phasin family protein [Luteimonas sp. BDR2-5]|uniref:phasin family protein n=1 Tax=Proluteimonas luteida TaxID=2878685 RepID=UPI001E61F89B|nr:phasin family protein [Luteimonas sp. BDR2-5]MCD9027225.1 phasin family protein [Luteimonas sp. BDR2-5]
MSYQFNEQFVAATRQFADATSQINHLTLENAEKVFGLHLSTLSDNTNATFSFFNDAIDVRDFDGFKALLPKGAQVARENTERLVSATQEVLGRTVKTQEAIAEIAKNQIESASADVRAEAEKVAKAASKASKR